MCAWIVAVCGCAYVTVCVCVCVQRSDVGVVNSCEFLSVVCVYALLGVCVSCLILSNHYCRACFFLVEVELVFSLVVVMFYLVPLLRVQKWVCVYICMDWVCGCV